MGLAAVTAFERSGGRLLAVAGETRGDTGSAAMERRLAAGWELAREPVPLPAYGDTAAFLTLWRLRPKAASDGDTARSTTTASALPTRVRVEISGRLGEPLVVCITALDGRGVGTGRTRSTLAAAKSRPVSHADVSKAVGTLGDTAFALDPAHVSVSMADGLFISLAEVKDARRDAVRAFTAAAAAATAAAAPSQAAAVAAAAAAAAVGRDGGWGWGGGGGGRGGGWAAAGGEGAAAAEGADGVGGL